MGTMIEQALAAAMDDGDPAAYLRALFATDIYAYVDKARVDRAIKHGRVNAALEARYWATVTRDGKRFLAVYTRGALPPRRADRVACQIAFPMPARARWGWRRAGVAVNPGTPTEMVVRAKRQQLDGWRLLADDIEHGGHDHDVLLTAHDVVLKGDLAHALGCGAHLAVHARTIWNEFGDVHTDYLDDLEGLASSWGVENHDQWCYQLESLLDGQPTTLELEAVLAVRREHATQVADRRYDVDTWIADCEERIDADPDAVSDLVLQVVAYERRFHEDGLLAEEEFVGSAAAYDLGRAVNFARWGLGARLCHESEARRGILEAGARARDSYLSWRDFSAGYILGRVIRFDNLSFGHMYASALTPHNILMTNPESPWLTVPFH